MMNEFKAKKNGSKLKENESKARNLSLLFISIEILLFYLFVVFSGLYAQIDELAYNRDVSVAGLMIFIGFFTVVAAILVMGTFFKWIYYLLAIAETIFFLFSRFQIIFTGSLLGNNLILSAIVFFPYVLYLGLLLFSIKKKRPIQ